MQPEASVSQASVSFLHLDGKSRDQVNKSFLCSRCGSYVRTHSDPNGNSSADTTLDPSDRLALTPGIKTALRRLHVNLGHPTNDDLTRCFAAGGGTRVAQRAVKCMRCSTSERMSRPRSHRPSHIPTDGEWICVMWWMRGNRYWWLVAVDQHTDYTVIAPCPSHESQAVAQHIFKHWTRCTGPSDVLVRRRAGPGASESFTGTLSCQGLRCKP